MLGNKMFSIIFGRVTSNPEFNKLAEAVTPLACIREVSSSNLDQNTTLTEHSRAFIQSLQARRDSISN
jgi:hypothetical protein